MTGQVLMRDLDDEFLTDPQSLFPMGRLVSARVLSASQTEGTAKLSLKQSVIVGDKKADEEIKGITVRSTIEGTVQRVTPIGVFVCIKGTSLVGLCRRGAACEDSEELADLYEAGAFVRAKVLGVNRNSKKVALGLKPSFFAKEDKNGGTAGDDSGDEDSDDDDEEEESEGDSAADDDRVVMLNAEDDGSDDEMDAMIRAASVRPSEEEDEVEERPKSFKKQRTAQAVSKEVVIVDLHEEEEEEEDSDDDDDDAGPSIFAPSRALKAGSSSGIQWGDFKPKETASALAATAADESEDDSEGEEAGPEEKSKGSRTRQREVLKRKEEEAIRARESSLEAGNSLPERPEDFERLLLAEPSSSLLWIKYMSHYLSQADLDATRQIAEKALRTIHFKEEEEKMNVWIAYVNMEHKYGNMASLDAVFKRAVAESKGKVIHLNLAEAYESAKDLGGATAMLEKALKKYKTSKKVWMAFQHFKLRSGDSEGAKALLGRSMQSLSRHKHIEVLIK
jgi:rRNA biogenesis protein RRP5